MRDHDLKITSTTKVKLHFFTTKNLKNNYPRALKLILIDWEYYLMSVIFNSSKLYLKPIVFGTFLLSVGLYAVSRVQAEPLPTANKIDLEQYLGTWYEIARKPLYFQKKCDHNVTATYSLNHRGNIQVDNRCYTKSGDLKHAIGEAFVKNPPKNTKLKVSFLPKMIRWLPIGRGDYWILKIDPNYETVLVGGPNRKQLWILSRSQHPDQTVVQDYLNYATEIGYDLSDLIHSQQIAE